MFDRIKKYIKAQIDCCSANILGYYCPTCSLTLNYITAFMNCVYNPYTKNYGKYIKCEECGKTTPAFDNIKQTEENWSDQWISREVDLFEND